MHISMLGEPPNIHQQCSQFSLLGVPLQAHGSQALFRTASRDLEVSACEGNCRCLEVMFECWVARKIKWIRAAWRDGRRLGEALGVKAWW